ncbi:MAG: hypothetical protein HF978_09345 [Desulfobacteraceae bacterium]|nr:hypothetical protein [Desulfobacteraceae bacterium]MBC2755740.1 hypothetical protein [Desulfobacteraceae bacterium]
MTNLSVKPEVVRRVHSYIDPGQLALDLETLRGKCLQSGASDAAVIQKETIVFNTEILKKVASDNQFPSIHWPLNYPKDDLEEAINAYQWAVFFKIDVDDTFIDYGGGPIAGDTHRKLFEKIYEIVTIVESSGFYMGYHLSLGLGAGNCRAVFCPDEKRCWPMLKGKTCIRPNMGRPSMEAAGIDASAVAEKLNWFLPGNNSFPILAGLVLIV